ncbi:MAG: nucleoside hydrolase [Chloroflexi bacterium]|nr:nucleoside hydrolase [Chloroflexota bacterium]
MSKQRRGAEFPMPVFIDTDAGCDDTLAIAWLLRRPEARVVGMSTVFGNSSVQNTTANLLTLLATMQCDVPVTMGASAPLVYPRTRAGALAHGPDGLWGAQLPQSLDSLPQGAPGAIAAAARAHPGLTVIAIGPLTNIARAVQAYPEDMAGVRLVALAGAHGAGTITPAAEFNAFADPHALAIVLDSQLQVELVTRDAFQALQLDLMVAHRLEQEGGAPGRLLAQVLTRYARAISNRSGPIALPDPVAVIYALHPDLGVALPATVRVVTEGELTRGQTIVALSEQHQAALALGASGVEHLASHATSPDFDVADALRAASSRAPRNARVVLQIEAVAMAELFEEGLMELGLARIIGG